MYVQCSKVYQKKTGTLSLNRKLVESYRDPKSGKPRNRTVKKLEKLPILERARLIFQHGGAKHLRDEEWRELKKAGDLIPKKVANLKVGDVYSGAGMAVGHFHLLGSGLWSTLSKHLSKGAARTIKEFVLHQIHYPSSKHHFVESRKNEYLYALEGRNPLSNTSVHRAMNELEEAFTNIKDELNQEREREGELLLYDLSNSYFCGTKAELGGYGQSKEKRHDRYIVTYGLVTDKQGQPMDIKVWKGGTADAKTVVDQFTDWQSHYHAERGIWIADRAMSGEQNIAQITDLGLDFITGVPSTAQIAMLKSQQEESPGLFDQTGLAEFQYNHVRHIVCKHDSKGYRRERNYAKNRRRVYNELLRIQASSHNKNKEKLYHRAMKALEKYGQNAFWEIEVKAISKEDNQPQRYKLYFKLNREQVKLYNKIAHYYLLQTSLCKENHSADFIHKSYKELHRVERCFRELKDSLHIRPIYHYRKKKIKAHIYLSYLSLWLIKYIEKQWNQREIFSSVKQTLANWDRNVKLCQMLDENNVQVSLKWNRGENAKKAIEEIKQHGELKAIQALL